VHLMLVIRPSWNAMRSLICRLFVYLGGLGARFDRMAASASTN
jgi:hypothetical protein